MEYVRGALRQSRQVHWPEKSHRREEFGGQGRKRMEFGVQDIWFLIADFLIEGSPLFPPKPCTSSLEVNAFYQFIFYLSRAFFV